MPERRRHLRVQTSQPTLYYRDSSRRPRVGSVIDLSASGAAVETPYLLSKSESVDISIALGQSVFRSKARVIYTLWLETQRLRAGLEFEEMSSEDRRLLEEYLASQESAGTKS